MLQNVAYTLLLSRVVQRSKDVQRVLSGLTNGVLLSWVRQTHHCCTAVLAEADSPLLYCCPGWGRLTIAVLLSWLRQTYGGDALPIQMQRLLQLKKGDVVWEVTGTEAVGYHTNHVCSLFSSWNLDTCVIELCCISYVDTTMDDPISLSESVLVRRKFHMQELLRPHTESLVYVTTTSCHCFCFTVHRSIVVCWTDRPSERSGGSNVRP